VFFDAEERAVRVSIIEVNNVFTLASVPGLETNERYRGRDQNLYIKPHIAGGSSNIDFVNGAICIDGFLNIGDEAMYHTDEFELPGGSTVLRYFTQGRPYGNGTIVNVAQTNASDPTKYDVTIVDPTALSTLGAERAIFGVEVLNGSVEVGDKTSLVVQGDAPVSPGASNGTIFINGTAQEGAGVTAVEITSISGLGAPDASAIVQSLDAGGSLDSNGTITSGVIPIPNRHLAQVGDQGFLATVTIGSGTANFMQIAREGFTRFVQS
jgi:hypothetical protein